MQILEVWSEDFSQPDEDDLCLLIRSFSGVDVSPTYCMSQLLHVVRYMTFCDL